MKKKRAIDQGMNSSPKISKPSDEFLTQVTQRFDLRKLQFLRKLENSIYKAEQSGKEVFVRFTSRLHRSPEQIAAELAWIQDLKKEGFGVPNIIPASARELSTDVRYEDELFHITIFEKVPGQHPALFQDTFFEKMGNLLAHLHNQVEKYGYKNLDREPWDGENATRLAKSFAARNPDDPFSKSFFAHLEWLKTLPKNASSYGLIHGDLNPGNLFVTEDNKVYIIDFDSSCFHWFVFDLATLLMPIIRLQNDSNTAYARDTLVSSYRKVRPISDEDVSLIPNFVNFRLLRLAMWASEQTYSKMLEPAMLPHIEKLNQDTKVLLVSRGVLTEQSIVSHHLA